jgi:molybdopterin/thiamine biosynthesis adenylyltransferase
MARLRILPDQYDAFSRAMLASSPDESVALGFAGWWDDPKRGLTLVWRDQRLADDADYERRGPGGAVVRPQFLAPGVKRVRGTGEALILSHTHPFSARPGFSGIDDGGEDVLIPKVRERAPDAPHGGLVLGQEYAAARVWPVGRESAEEIDLAVLGHGATGRPDPDFDRQERAFGPGTSAALAGCSVAIVGTGGLGWDMATLLAAHGVGRLVLVDPDVVEPHNRPRLRGARPPADGEPKVEVLRDLLCGSSPRLVGEAFAAPFADPAARRAVATTDLVITATDNLASRLDVDRFARRLLIPLVDAGINLEVDGGSLRRVGGRVSVAWPTGPCLVCMGVLTPDAVAAEVDPIGYRGDRRQVEAAVASFNAVVAGLAVTEVLMIMLGARPDVWRSRYLVYDGLRARVREIEVPEPGRCGSCGGLAGAVFGTLP